MASSASALDRFDLDGGVVLAVSAAPPTGVLAGAVPIDQNFLPAALLDDRSGHLRAGDGWGADLEGVAVTDRQDLVERDLGAGLRIETVDADDLSDLDAMLFPARLDDCVHGRTPTREKSLRTIDG